MFKACEPELTLRLSSTKRVFNFNKGQVIFYEGHPVFGLYCVNAGKIKIYRTTADGKRKIMRIAGPGELIGHWSLFADESYSCTAEALEEVMVCFIDRRGFYPLISDSKEVTWQIIRNLAQELVHADKHTTEIAHLSVRERLAGMLLLLKERYSENFGAAIKINLPLTREDLADLIGSSTETTVRILSEFREEEIIRTEQRYIVILSSERLSKIAGFRD
ncbi:MAG: Crp/Fnr family transcriptional regulator [Fidelibacterota bacterium]